ncbi:4'-phosphopantetheinyl transferase superfamily protein [Agrobacterium vitis]|nr:4'-phosphopantetheinyl transferase superfamily protein [Agrobacterium vitis]MCM2442241.1 4'-phosphopantetheinyl transferase superfamily protein [Agrobacterium vitis]
MTSTAQTLRFDGLHLCRGSYPLEIHPDEIHVWLVASDVWGNSAAPDRNVLSAGERAKLSRLRLESDRRSYRVAHETLRQLLSAYCPSVEPKAWQFEYGTAGRPDLKASESGLTFNLSHTCGQAALAFARDCQLGVDVETVIADTDLDLAESICTTDELRALRALPQVDQPRRFTQLWTLKEAYLKAIGKGLSQSPQSIGFRFLESVEISHQIMEPLDAPNANFRFCSSQVSATQSLAVAWGTPEARPKRRLKIVRLAPDQLAAVMQGCFPGHDQDTRALCSPSISTAVARANFAKKGDPCTMSA